MKAETKMTAIISAKVTRADGTEEDLGIISATDAEADKVVSLLQDIKPDAGDGTITVEEADRRSQEANEGLRKQLEGDK